MSRHRPCHAAISIFFKKQIVVGRGGGGGSIHFGDEAGVIMVLKGFKSALTRFDFHCNYQYPRALIDRSETALVPAQLSVI